MIFKYLRKNLAFCAALLIFIGAGTGSLSAYREVRKRNSAGYSYLDSIPSGEHAYGATSRGQCVGSFDTSLGLEGETLTFIAKGSVNTAFRGAVTAAEMSVKAYFNSLGQMMGSYSKATAGDAQIELATFNVNPLDIIVKVKLGDKSYKYKTPVPGPVEIQKNKDSTYRLRYTYLSNPQALNPQGILLPFLNALDFKIAAAGENQPDCTAAPSATLDLTATLALLQQSLSKFQGVLNLAGPLQNVTATEQK